jgi:hypothetical protein
LINLIFRLSKAPKVKFALTPEKPSSSNNGSQKRWLVKDLREIVEGHTARRYYLNLLIDSEKLWQLQPNPSIEAYRDLQQVSLAELLGSKAGSSGRVGNRTSSLLQLALASGFLHLYEGPWFIKSWNKSHICFYWDKCQTQPDLTKPYVVAQCKPLNEDDNSKIGQFDVHPYPGILRLGILLLEIELNRSIEDERRPKGVISIDSDGLNAKRWLSECDGNSSNQFCEAVQACLDAKTFKEFESTNSSFNDRLFRQKFFELIVRPLEEAIYNNWSISVEQVDDWTPPPKIIPRGRRPQQDPIVKQSNKSPSTMGGEHNPSSKESTPQSQRTHAIKDTPSISAYQGSSSNRNDLPTLLRSQPAASIRYIGSNSDTKVSVFHALCGISLI